MEKKPYLKRARIIRYTTLPDDLLSRYDRERNIMEIDINKREFLREITRDMLDVNNYDATRLCFINGRIMFEPVE